MNDASLHYRIFIDIVLEKNLSWSSQSCKDTYILRVTDKSCIFHLVHAADHDEKAEAYRPKTRAYVELASDPIWTVFDKAVRLLNDLRSKKHTPV